MAKRRAMRRPRAWLWSSVALMLLALPLVLAARPSAGRTPRRLLAAAHRAAGLRSITRPERGLAAQPGASSQEQQQQAEGQQLLLPRMGNVGSNWTYYWQLPEGDPLGLVVLLHRCGGGGYDFWPLSGEPEGGVSSAS